MQLLNILQMPMICDIDFVPGIIEHLMELESNTLDNYAQKLKGNNSVVLLGLVVANLTGLFVVLSIPKFWEKTVYYVALFSSMFLFIYSMGLWLFFNQQTSDFQYVYKNSSIQLFNAITMLGVDSLSLLFVILTTFTFPFCIVSCKEEGKAKKMLFVNLLFLELCIILSFSVLDLFFFCVSFESIIIPMIFIMILAGKRERRLTAITYLVLYTLFGSIFLLVGMLQVWWALDTFNYFAIMDFTWREGLDFDQQRSIWLLIMVAFALKVPIFPFHLWLPEAHVEAPTTGSVVLAGLLLKLGSYGIVRLLFLFTHSRYYYQNVVAVICLFSVLLASVVALNQQDMKRIVAYSSIAHMNFAIIGFFAQNIYGLTGGMFLMISHGIVSSSLFLMVGMLYWRYAERDIKKFGGLVLIMPLFSTFFGILICANASVPLTVNFVGEFLVLLGIAQAAFSDFFVLLAFFSTLLGLIYSLKFFNQIVFGTYKVPNFSQVKLDLTRTEFTLIFPLICFTFIFGIAPAALLAVVYYSLQYLLLSAQSAPAYMDMTSIEPSNDFRAERHAFTMSHMDTLDRTLWQDYITLTDNKQSPGNCDRLVMKDAAYQNEAEPNVPPVLGLFYDTLDEEALELYGLQGPLFGDRKEELHILLETIKADVRSLGGDCDLPENPTMSICQWWSLLLRTQHGWTVLTDLAKIKCIESGEGMGAEFHSIYMDMNHPRHAEIRSIMTTEDLDQALWLMESRLVKIGEIPPTQFFETAALQRMMLRIFEDLDNGIENSPMLLKLKAGTLDEALENLQHAHCSEIIQQYFFNDKWVREPHSNHVLEVLKLPTDEVLQLNLVEMCTQGGGLWTERWMAQMSREYLLTYFWNIVNSADLEKLKADPMYFKVLETNVFTYLYGGDPVDVFSKWNFEDRINLVIPEDAEFVAFRQKTWELENEWFVSQYLKEHTLQPTNLFVDKYKAQMTNDTYWWGVPTDQLPGGLHNHHFDPIALKEIAAAWKAFL